MRTDYRHFIRWLIALVGGNPTHVVLPPHRTMVHVTVREHHGVYVAFIWPPAKRPPAAVNLIYLTGTVATVLPEGLELTPASQGRDPIHVQFAGTDSSRLPDVQPGENVALLGTVESTGVRATSLWRLQGPQGNTVNSESTW